MVSATYEYLTATVVVGILFVTAVVVTPNVSYMSLLYVDEQQLRNIALEALKTLLLDPGYPLDWGTANSFDQNDVERFGLELTGCSSPYILDADKVQRLVVDNPLNWLEYEKARELLGVQGYGFNIKIFPPFNVNVETSRQGNTLAFDVFVKFDDKRPVPKAVVNTIYVYSYKNEGSQEDKYFINFTQYTAITDELGSCRIEHKLQQGRISDNVTVIRTTVADLTTVTTVEGHLNSSVAGANMVGDEIILTRPEKSEPNDNRWICDIVALTEDGLITIYDGNKNDTLNYGSKNLWRKTLPGLKDINPTFVFVDINAVEKQEGRRGTIVIGPYPNYVGSRVINYGGIPAGPSVKLQRVVNISGLTYIFELVLWKE